MKVFKNTRIEQALKRFSPRDRKGPSPEGNFLFCAIWVISALLAFLIPLIYRTIHKRKYNEIYLSYYWEQEYEYYEEQRQNNYEKYGNNYNYGGAYMYSDNYMQREYWDVNHCRWWQMNCFPYYVNQDGEPMPDQGWYPNWYSGWALSEEDREEMQDRREQPGSLKFVYIWQLLMFFVITWYGLLVIRQNRNPTGLIIALLVWTNFAFMSLWLMADGSIVIDGDEVKRIGFYGQMSVLIFMSNFWYFLHGIVFLIVFFIRKIMLDDEESRMKEAENAQKMAEEEETNAKQQEAYQAPSE